MLSLFSGSRSRYLTNIMLYIIILEALLIALSQYNYDVVNNKQLTLRFLKLG